jgi:nicotinamide mononucleotide (NMN) deamidase PncC
MSIQQLVREIHATPVRLVIAVTGGGSGAIGQLLQVPGASRTVLEAIVPYSPAALGEWLAGPPEQACSSETARAMAMAAFLRACRLDDSAAARAGVACTASLASDRPKRGPHRVHLAVQSAAVTEERSLQLVKGARSRVQEERLVSRLVLGAVAEACGLGRGPRLVLLEGEAIDESRVVAPRPWQDLLLGKVEKVPHGGPDDQVERPPEAILSGSFNPIHAGHRRMAEMARERLGVPVDFEMPILNADKPPLDYCELGRRLGPFRPEETVWLTRCGKFVEKSLLFPGVTFVVGTDTLRRIADPRFYGGDPAARRASLDEIAKRGCRFLVFGRDTGEGFVGLSDLELPEPLPSLCREVPASEFRDDVSSTAIRQRGEW